MYFSLRWRVYSLRPGELELELLCAAAARHDCESIRCRLIFVSKAFLLLFLNGGLFACAGRSERLLLIPSALQHVLVRTRNSALDT